MARRLLDSDAVIDFLYNIPGSIDLIERLFAAGDALCSCDIVLAEVYTGLHSHEQARAERLLARLQYLATTPEAARQAGVWRYAYMRRGQTLAVTDCLIAAIAVSHQATVVTGNVKDFPMPEVAILPLPRVRAGG